MLHEDRVGVRTEVVPTERVRLVREVLQDEHEVTGRIRRAAGRGRAAALTAAGRPAGLGAGSSRRTQADLRGVFVVQEFLSLRSRNS